MLDFITQQPRAFIRDYYLRAIEANKAAIQRARKAIQRGYDSDEMRTQIACFEREISTWQAKLEAHDASN